MSLNDVAYTCMLSKQKHILWPSLIQFIVTQLLGTRYILKFKFYTPRSIWLIL